MEELKLYIFNNIIGNYCSGDFYFVASNISDANKFANKFASEHNQKTNNNQNYIIEWDEEPRECYLQEGYFPINRVVIPAIKTD